MSNKQIQIIGVKPSHDVQSVAQRIARLFENDISKAFQALTAGPVTLERKFSDDKAQQLVKQLQNAGVMCKIISITENDKPFDFSQEISFSNSESPKSRHQNIHLSSGLELEPEKDVIAAKNQYAETLENTQTNSELTTCPKCGKAQPKTQECVYCGIIIEKFLAAQERVNQRGLQYTTTISNQHEGLGGFPVNVISTISEFLRGQVKTIVIVLLISSPLFIFGKGFSVLSLMFPDDDEVHYFASADPLTCINMAQLSKAYENLQDNLDQTQNSMADEYAINRKLIRLEIRLGETRGQEKQNLSQEIDKLKEKRSQLRSERNEANYDRSDLWNSEDGGKLREYMNTYGNESFSRLVQRYSGEAEICRVDYEIAIGNTGTILQEKVKMDLKKDIIVDLTNCTFSG